MNTQTLEAPSLTRDLDSAISAFLGGRDQIDKAMRREEVGPLIRMGNAFRICAETIHTEAERLSIGLDSRGKRLATVDELTAFMFEAATSYHLGVPLARDAASVVLASSQWGD